MSRWKNMETKNKKECSDLRFPISGFCTKLHGHHMYMMCTYGNTHTYYLMYVHMYVRSFDGEFEKEKGKREKEKREKEKRERERICTVLRTTSSVEGQK